MRWKKAALALTGTSLLLYAVLWGGGIRFNFTSDSLPLGIYRVVKTQPRIGALAASCLTPELASLGLERGYLRPGICPTGIRPVMKRIAAMPGDDVTLYQSDFRVNGQPILRIPAQQADSVGRGLSSFTSQKYRLQPGQYWLISTCRANSWDSRYWGPVSIIYVLKPLWIWES